MALAALIGVLGSGLLRGVMIGAAISIVQLIRRASRPHLAFLGRIPGSHRFSDLARHEDNETVPGLLICRPESGLVYFNIDHVRDTLIQRIRATTPPPRLVLLDLSAAPHVVGTDRGRGEIAFSSGLRKDARIAIRSRRPLCELARAHTQGVAWVPRLMQGYP